MNIKYILAVIFIITAIFLFGIIIQFIYMTITPSSKLTTKDCKRKNYWYKYLKFKK